MTTTGILKVLQQPMVKKIPYTIVILKQIPLSHLIGMTMVMVVALSLKMVKHSLPSTILAMENLNTTIEMGDI